MTVSTPPRPASFSESVPALGPGEPGLEDPALIEALREEALIEEARRRARKRRLRNGLSVSIVAAVALVGALAVRGSGASHAPARLPSPARPNPAAAAFKSGGQLTVIGIPTTGRQEPPAQADGWYALSTVGRSGQLHYLVRCPGHAKWCGNVESLDWSENGRWLALSVTSYGAANPYNGIHVVDLATGVDRQLRFCPPECDWFDLAWSPDAARLAYVTGGEIHLINRDGSRHQLLQTRTPGAISSPSWSADGTRIAFAARSQPHQPSSVYITRADGTRRALLARGASAPAWSPDGTRIAVTSRCDGIKLVTPTGKDVTPSSVRTCRVIGMSGIPIWSPDSKRIAIAGHKWNQGGIYVMNANGSNLRLLTTEIGGRGVTGRPDASWQPHRTG